MVHLANPQNPPWISQMAIFLIDLLVCIYSVFLYIYFQLLEALDDDVISRRQKLSTTFEQMSTVIDGSSN